MATGANPDILTTQETVTKPLTEHKADFEKDFFSVLQGGNPEACTDQQIVWAARLIDAAHLPADVAVRCEADNQLENAARLNEFRSMYLQSEWNKRAFVSAPPEQRAALLNTLHRRNSFAALTSGALMNLGLDEVYPTMRSVFANVSDLERFKSKYEQMMYGDWYRSFVDKNQQAIMEKHEYPSAAFEAAMDRLSRFDRALMQSMLINHVYPAGSDQRPQGLALLGVPYNFPDLNPAGLTRDEITQVYENFSSPTSISKGMLQLAARYLLQ